MKRWLLAALAAVALVSPGAVRGQASPAASVQHDVVYGRKYGMGLLMDVLAPATKNGAGAIFVSSGGWVSPFGGPFITPAFFSELLNRGYTVFVVAHGSQPKFTIPEILPDIQRAVRFIRVNAGKYGIDPQRIGIFGMSAGGHLSLMQGLAPDQGRSDTVDPVDLASSRVQAVVAFFPPTDFLNYGGAGKVAADAPALKPFRPPFDFHELDKNENRYERVTDPAKLQEILKQISPVTHVSRDAPPVLLIHGDADTLVPIQQSQELMDKLKAVNVPVQLIVKPKAGHAWLGIEKDFAQVADWFDKYMPKK